MVGKSVNGLRNILKIGDFPTNDDAIAQVFCALCAPLIRFLSRRFTENPLLVFQERLDHCRVGCADGDAVPLQSAGQILSSAPRFAFYRYSVQ